MLGQRKRPRLGGARASRSGAYLTYASQQPASAQFVPVTGGAGLIGPAPFFVLAQPSHSQAETAISPNPVVASTNKHHSTKSIAATPSARRTDNRALQWRFLTGGRGAMFMLCGWSVSVLQKNAAREGASKQRGPDLFIRTSWRKRQRSRGVITAWPRRLDENPSRSNCLGDNGGGTS